jgi:hypothetical protein
LFPEAPAYRLNEPSFTGTPMPKDEPLAHNPPFGALIDYTLPANFAGPVSIAIYDQNHVLVNRFNSTDPVKQVDLSKLTIAPEWVITSKPPATTPGHHRFVWNLHYAKLDQSAEGKGSGVWAPPGHYSVELTAGGQVLRQQLTILADPRVKVTQADFDAQFRLAKQIEAAQARVETMSQEAASLKAGIAKLSDASEAASLNAQMDMLVGSSAAVEGIVAPTTLNGIEQWLDKLSSAVDGADGAPTPDGLRGFALISDSLNSFEPRWRAFAASARARVPTTH